MLVYWVGVVKLSRTLCMSIGTPCVAKHSHPTVCAYMYSILQCRGDLENHSVDAASTSEAVGFITLMQELKRKVRSWEQKVEVRRTCLKNTRDWLCLCISMLFVYRRCGFLSACANCENSKKPYAKM